MVIVDTSVVYKWIIDEDEGSTQVARHLLTQFLSGKEKVLVPNILLYELGNVLASKTGLEAAYIEAAWERLGVYQLSLFTPDLGFIARCIDFSKRYQISVYDAAFVVLSQEQQCDLITADAKLVNKLHLPFVKLLSEFSS